MDRRPGSRIWPGDFAHIVDRKHTAIAAGLLCIGGGLPPGHPVRHTLPTFDRSFRDHTRTARIGVTRTTKDVRSTTAIEPRIATGHLALAACRRASSLHS